MFSSECVTIPKEILEKLIKDKSLTVEALRVFLYFASYLDSDHCVLSTQKDASVALGMPKSNISRAVTLLMEKKLVEKIEKEGVTKNYKLALYKYKHLVGYPGVGI